MAALKFVGQAGSLEIRVRTGLTVLSPTSVCLPLETQDICVAVLWKLLETWVCAHETFFWLVEESHSLYLVSAGLNNRRTMSALMVYQKLGAWPRQITHLLLRTHRVSSVEGMEWGTSEQLFTHFVQCFSDKIHGSFCCYHIFWHIFFIEKN